MVVDRPLIFFSMKFVLLISLVEFACSTRAKYESPHFRMAVVPEEPNARPTHTSDHPLGTTFEDYFSVTQYDAMLKSNDTRIKTHAARIPNVVHRIMLRDPEFPTEDKDLLSDFFTKTKDEFIHLLWRKEDAERLLTDHFPTYKPVYDAYPKGIQRADFIRYAILHHYGGIYSDTDVELKGNLKVMIEDTVKIIGSGGIDFLGDHERTLSPSERESSAHFPIRQHLPGDDKREHAWRVSNYFLMSTATSNGAKAVLDLCLERAKLPLDMSSDYDILFTTGPDVVSTVVNKNYDMAVVEPATEEMSHYVKHICRGHWRVEEDAQALSERATTKQWLWPSLLLSFGL